MQLNSGFKEFSDLNNALSSISDAELQKADVPELQKKTIAASLKVLNQLGSLAHLGNDSETRAAAQSLVGRLKPLLDKSGPASQLANDISSVCTNILSGRPRSQTVSLASRPRSNSQASRLDMSTPSTRRMSISAGSEVAKALQAERGGALLSPRDIEFDGNELLQLREMHKFISREAGTSRPSETQCKNFAMLMRKARGNMAVNKQVSALLQQLDPSQSRRSSRVIPQNIPPSDVLHLMKEFSFRTKELQNPEQSVKQLQTLVDGFFDKTPVANEAKMTMKELGTLDSFRKCEPACKMIRDLNLGKFDPSGDLASIAKANHKAGLLIAHIENALANTSNFRPGDIVSTVPERLSALRSRDITAGEAKQMKIQGGVPVTHTAVVFQAADGSQKMSHIVEKLEVDDFGLLDRLSMVGVRIDPMALVQGPTTLKPDEVRSKFQEMTNALHQDVKPDDMQLPNSSKSKLKAGVASLVPVLTMTVSSKKGGDWLKEFNSLVQSKPGERPQQDMICSAWGALSQAAAFDRLNAAAEKTAFRSPFPGNKNLNLMTPASLLQELAKSGCIAVVKPEALLGALIKSEELEPPSQILQMCGSRVVDTPSTPKLGFIPEEVGSPFESAQPRNPEHLKSKWVSSDQSELASEKINGLAKDVLHQTVKDMRGVIKQGLEQTQTFIGATRDDTGLRQLSSALIAKEGAASLIAGGTGGTYLVKNAEGRPSVVIKPDDESPLCLHNPKGNASPLQGKILRSTIPLGNDAMRARLTYQVANRLGLACTPKTEVAILESKGFHDITDGLVPTRFKQLGQAVRTKVCSVQEFVPNAISVEDYLDSAKAKMRDRHITEDHVMDNFVDSVDKQSLEDVVFLTCISGATDANPGNILLVNRPPPEDHQGPFYGMTLIDTPLSWPDAKGEFSVFFKGILPLTGRPLSDETVQRILFFPVDGLVADLKAHGMSDKVIDAAKQRLQIMQSVAQHHGATAEDLLISIDRGKDILASRAEPQLEADDILAGMGATTFVSSRAQSTMINLDE